ncbi:hypothetical protein BHE74_00014331 [Ensete ventricosum]|nr:hypothetical protein BHE74_00014331 [Ensete ventricosum]
MRRAREEHDPERQGRTSPRPLTARLLHVRWRRNSIKIWEKTTHQFGANTSFLLAVKDDDEASSLSEASDLRSATFFLALRFQSLRLSITSSVKMVSFIEEPI